METASTIHAPAKLNLYLHILGRRADGYHDIETMAAFTALGDTLTVKPAKALSLEVHGPFAKFCGEPEQNLVLRAARALAELANSKKGAAFTLEKHIPPGAGLGGGSSDAAAALKLLNELWQLGLSAETLAKVAATIGADVPMCLAANPVIARGLGEQLSPLPTRLPPLPVVLVYPMRPLATAEVYGAFTKEAAPLTPPLAGIDTAKGLFKMLEYTRNQLQRPAITLMAEIGEILLALETAPQRPPFVRMSGSGSACYALLEDAAEAEALAGFIQARHPAWWVKATSLLA